MLPFLSPTGSWAIMIRLKKADTWRLLRPLWLLRTRMAFVVANVQVCFFLWELLVSACECVSRVVGAAAMWPVACTPLHMLV